MRAKRLKVLSKGYIIELAEKSLQELVKDGYVKKIKAEAIWLSKSTDPKLEILFAAKISDREIYPGIDLGGDWVNVKGVIDPCSNIDIIKKQIKMYVMEVLHGARPSLFEGKIKIFTPMAVYVGEDSIHSVIPKNEMK